jgi:Domain of unknown function (DUF4338)
MKLPKCPIPYPHPKLCPDILLEFCSAADSRYRRIRRRHYVKDRGAVGRQIHFVAWYQGQMVGIISGGSAVWESAPRDKFFDITDANRREVIQTIVDNSVCRMVVHERGLMQKVLSVWRKVVVPHIWFDLYGEETIGYETFVIPRKVKPGVERKGQNYKGDNWTQVGVTRGAAKSTKGCKQYNPVSALSRWGVALLVWKKGIPLRRWPTPTHQKRREFVAVCKRRKRAQANPAARNQPTSSLSAWSRTPLLPIHFWGRLFGSSGALVRG